METPVARPKIISEDAPQEAKREYWLPGLNVVVEAHSAEEAVKIAERQAQQVNEEPNE